MKSLFSYLLLFILSFATMAGVNLKNGNYYVSYTDIIVPGGGNDLSVIRTYNSKATKKGWFGFGWGSDYETFLNVSADGSVIIHENGSGARTRFTPRTQVDSDAAAKKILAAMRKSKTVSDKAAAKILKRLKENAEYRQAYARRYKVTASLASGTVLFTNTRGLQQLHVTKNGYERRFNDGKVDFFDKDGKLVKIKDKNGYTVNIDYKNGNVASIKDSQAKQLFFSWYPDKKVKSIWGPGDKKTLYKYKGDDLVESKDVADNIFKYKYDGNHNMIAINYVDGSSMKIAYTPTQFVKEITSRNNESTKYSYDNNPKNPNYHYWTTVEKKTASGKSTKNRYEYELKTRPDGSRYTYRILTEISGVKTETVYSECCSLPLKITRGKNTTTFEYNEKGLLTKKTSTKGEYIELDYHKKFNKITKVTNKNGTTKFSYDKRGNLHKAQNNDKRVLLVYDSKGRITKMVDMPNDSKRGGRKARREKRVLAFKYNSLGKPVEISMQGIGKINVAYDNFGEIKRVESKAGHKMALQVTQAFQSLLSIVKPAGVNLNM